MLPNMYSPFRQKTFTMNGNQKTDSSAKKVKSFMPFFSLVKSIKIIVKYKEHNILIVRQKIFVTLVQFCE